MSSELFENLEDFLEKLDLGVDIENWMIVAENNNDPVVKDTFLKSARVLITHSHLIQVSLF